MKETKSISLQKKATYDYLLIYGSGFIFGIVSWIFYGLLLGVLIGVIIAYIAKWLVIDRTIVGRGSYIMPSALSENAGCYEVIPHQSLLESDNEEVTALLEREIKQTRTDTIGTLIFFIGFFQEPGDPRADLEKIEVRMGPPRNVDRSMPLDELNRIV